ncbi:MAG: GH3 auxin-responsive promoter family protein [Candidatus Omnitrophica bacterium]|nr:GH3 auxin-responsive promoter family protein [Candidatus Omnitrophota bacterium]
MNILSILLKYLEPRRQAFEASADDPLKAQEQTLLKYLWRNKDTEFGRKYNFDAIRSIDDYRRAVPINSYETIRAYVDKIAGGAQNILTKDKVEFFGVTSGTTNKPKLIPTTNYSEKIKDSLLNLWSYYITRDHPGVLDGKILAIVSPEIEGSTEAGIPFGAESGYSYRTLPKPITGLYSLPYQVFEIENYESRHYAILRISIEQNISTIATLNPNTIVLLMRKIEKWQQLIIDDIATGKLSGEFEIKPDIRAILERSFKPNPGRADELEKILKTTGRLLPKHFWLNIKLIECWQGGMMKLYIKELEDYFGPIPKRDIGCVSTEARTSIPIKDDTASGVLAIRTNFYEFIPREGAAKPDRRTLLCTELREGEEYFIIVTTAGGLYRYNIDDIIKITGFFKRTPLIEFVQKGLGATSLAGEKLYESHVNEAITSVMEKEKVRLEFFCAVAKPMEGPRYAFLAEFSPPAPADKDIVRILGSIEEELRRQNREYDYVRQAQLLGSPVMKILRLGSFENYRIRRITEGAKEGQFKAPELTADCDFENNFAIEKIVHLPDGKI